MDSNFCLSTLVLHSNGREGRFSEEEKEEAQQKRDQNETG